MKLLLSRRSLNYDNIVFHGDIVMTNRNQFTAEEWAVLRDLPLMASIYIMAISPQGVLGVFKEFASLRVALVKMLAHGSYYELIDRLRQDINSDEEREQSFAPGNFQEEGQMRKYVLDQCRSATQALYQKAGEDESAYYRRGVLWVCLQVARAAREGGWFGIKSVQVSENEQQAIRQIAFALGISAQEAVVEELPFVPQRAVPPSMAQLFDPQEWELLRQAPVWVSAALTAVSPNGALGMARELTALANAVQQAAARYPSNRLINALFDDMSLLTSQSEQVVEVGGQMTSEEAEKRAVELCRKTGELVEQKVTPQEAREYKEMVLFLAQKIAEGAMEGGILGVGAKKVSENEQRVLREISSALQVGEV